MPFDRLRETLETFACEHTDEWLALSLDQVLPHRGRTARDLQLLAGFGPGIGFRTMEQLLATRTFGISNRAVSALEGLLLDALDEYLDRVHKSADKAERDGLPGDAAALVAWLGERGLAARYSASIKVLGPRVEWLARQARITTVGEAACANEPAALRVAARAHLLDCAKLAAREAQLSRKREELLAREVAAELAALDARLLAAREARKGHPRSPGTFVSGEVEFAPSPARLLYFERDERNRPYQIATIELEGEELAIEARHGRRSELPGIALSALDAARGFLRSERARGHAELRAWACVPSWTRTLAAFDEVVARPRRHNPLSFCIKPQRDGVRVWVGDIARTKSGAPTFKQESVYSSGHELCHEDALVIRVMGRDSFSARPGLDELLAALVGHPRVYFDNALTRVRVERTSLRLRARSEGESIVIEAVVGSGAHERVLDARTLCGALADERCLVFHDAGVVRFAAVRRNEHAVLDALRRHGDRFPAAAASELLPRLERLGGGIEVEIAGELGGREVPGDERLIARLDGSAWPCVSLHLRVRPLATAPHCVPGAGAPRVRAVVDDEPAQALRDLDRERARAAELVAALGLPEGGDRFEYDLTEIERTLDVLARLREREDVVVEWLTEPITTRTVEREQLRVRITSQRDWFAIGGDIAVDGDKLALAMLLEAARKGSRYVEVSRGKLVELTDDLRSRLAAVADHVHVARDGSLQIAATAAPAVAELSDKAVVVPAFARVLERLRVATEIQPEVPAHLEPTLRPYQRDGFTWLMRLASWGAGGVLADDMGLGKTLQAIAVLSARASQGPALVIAPTSVTGNWFGELARFGQGLRAIDYRDKRGAALLRLGPGDVVVASYDLVARDIESFDGVKFATLIVDEAQAVKNASTQRAKAIRAIESDVCFALTGTPVENHLGELWSIFSIASPGLLGSWEQFRARFAQPIEVAGDPVARAGLARLIRPFLLRRTKESVAPELPAITETSRAIELGTKERAGYEAMRRAAIEQLAGRAEDPSSRFAALAALMRLRRLACHPRLIDGESRVPSAKMEAALELVDEILSGEHRALIFSQFTDHLALLKKELDARGVRYLYLDGSTKAAERTRLCAAFQAHEAPLFLISLRAGGTGLNLTAADYVVHLDPWWNPAVEDQATDRAHRIGQTRAVTVVRLVARATIEEAVVSLHGEKRALAEGLLEGTDVAARLSVRELVDLMRGGDEPANVPARRGRARVQAALTA